MAVAVAVAVLMVVVQLSMMVATVVVVVAAVAAASKKICQFPVLSGRTRKGPASAPWAPPEVAAPRSTCWCLLMPPLRRLRQSGRAAFAGPRTCRGVLANPR